MVWLQFELHEFAPNFIWQYIKIKSSIFFEFLEKRVVLSQDLYYSIQSNIFLLISMDKYFTDEYPSKEEMACPHERKYGSSSAG